MFFVIDSVLEFVFIMLLLSACAFAIGRNRVLSQEVKRLNDEIDRLQ